MRQGSVRTGLLVGLFGWLLAACGGGTFDQRAPQLNSVVPADGSVDVATGSTISLTFSEAIDDSTVSNATIGVYSARGWIAGQVTTQGNTVTFTPAVALDEGTGYKIYVASTVSDLAGNHLGAVSQTAFTTAVTDVAPQVVSTWPQDNAQAVFPARLMANFSEALDPATVTTATVTLSDGTPLSGEVETVADQVIFTLNPDQVMNTGASYTATLDATITDLTGNPLGSDYVWSFTTASLRGTAVQLEADDQGNALDVRLASDGAGNVLAVWRQFDGSWNSVYANYYLAGVGWQGATLIESGATGHARDVQLTMDPVSGDAVAVWSQFDGSYYSIYSAAFTAATQTWGAEVLLESANGNASGPQLVMDATGNVTAVWFQATNGKTRVYGNRATAGTWGSAQALSAAGHDARTPVVAVDSAGDVVAVWSENDTVQYGVYASRYSGGAWGSIEQLDQGEAGDAAAPAIVIDGNDVATVVWYQYGTSGNNPRTSIYASRLEGGVWTAAQLLEQADQGNAKYPQPTVDGADNVTVVWQQHDGERWNIMANRYSAASASWGTAALIEQDDSGDALAPQLDVDGLGNVEAVWQQYDGLRWNIEGARYDQGLAAWSAPTLLEDDSVRDSKGAARDALHPAMTIDGTGMVTAAWHQHDGSRHNIWATRF